MKRAHGDLTAEIGEALRQELAAKPYDVLHDHGPKAKHVGKIVSWFGDAKAPTRETALSQLDIAVVERDSGKACVLIEIEETNNRPKNLLGDVFGTLMGDRVTFRGRVLKVGAWTTLIVMGYGTGSQQPRNDLLVRNARACQPHLLPANRAIGDMIIESYGNDAELERMLKRLVHRALRTNGGKKQGAS